MIASKISHTLSILPINLIKHVNHSSNLIILRPRNHNHPILIRYLVLPYCWMKKQQLAYTQHPQTPV